MAPPMGKGKKKVNWSGGGVTFVVDVNIYFVSDCWFFGRRIVQVVRELSPMVTLRRFLTGKMKKMKKKVRKKFVKEQQRP